MKSLSGLSDSLASVIANPAKCKECGATTRLGNGVCVSCLMREGLEVDGEVSSEVFESVLAEVNVPDKEWRLGNYEILEEIGRGGMGVIYRARQRHSRRIVALKRLLGYHADSRETLVRFRREAEAVASLDHPNILPIYEVGESDDGLPFFSMKFAAGGSLQQVGPVLRSEFRQCVQLLAKIARATEHAHSRGILHRDLKPGNILLDGHGEPLVSDFGLAKWLDTHSDLTRSLMTFGTPGYIAPEQADGRVLPLTPATDVYSLGAVLFDLLTGRAPFLGTHALSVIRQASEMPAPKLRSLARSADRDLETICARCLERDPNARYQSAGDLAVDLERWLDGRPILARPVSAPTRIWRWCRRNPKLVTTAAACLVFGAAVIWVIRGNLVGPPEKSIAVLPFENVGGEEKNIVFTDEMQEDISSQLIKLSELKVIAGSSVQQYTANVRRDLRAIGQALGVRHVLDGSVRRAGGRVEVSARLVDTTTGAQIWAEHYNRDVPRSLSIQAAVAEAIANQLHAKLSPAQKAALEAHVYAEVKALALYRKGEALKDPAWADGQKESWLKSERLLNEALQLDPDCVDASAQLITVEWNLWRCESGEKGAMLRRRSLARQAFENVVRLDPQRHEAQSHYYYYVTREYEKAAQEWELAYPNSKPAATGDMRTAVIDRRRGRWEDSARRFIEAARLDPKGGWFTEAIRTLLMMRRYAEGEQFVRRWLPASPDADPISHAKLSLYLCELRLAKGDAGGANEFLARTLADAPYTPGDVHFDKVTAALCTRDYNSAAHLVASAPDLTQEGHFDPTPGLKLWFQAQIARGQHGAQSAQPAFIAARNDAGRRWGDSDAIAGQLSLLACMDAGAGRKDDAIREARQALTMCPIEKDAMEGPYFVENLALVYAWTGERDLAIEQLEALAKIPCGPSYGDLKLNPKWDDLRGDPRFEQMVASLTPKP